MLNISDSSDDDDDNDDTCFLFSTSKNSQIPSLRIRDGG